MHTMRAPPNRPCTERDIRAAGLVLCVVTCQVDLRSHPIHSSRRPTPDCIQRFLASQAHLLRNTHALTWQHASMHGSLQLNPPQPQQACQPRQPQCMRSVLGLMLRLVGFLGDCEQFMTCAACVVVIVSVILPAEVLSFLRK